MNQAQLDRIEAKLNKVIEYHEQSLKPITIDFEKILSGNEKFNKRLDERLDNLKVRFGGDDYESLNKGIGSAVHPNIPIEPQQRQLVARNKTEDLSLIKRVEYFGYYSKEGMKPSKTVKYYLFGFILIYSNIELLKQFKTPSAKEE